MACLASPIATVGPEAVGQQLRRRWHRVRRRPRSGGSSPSPPLRRRRPSRRAAACDFARARPTSRGSSQVEPESGLKPRSTNGSQNTASAAATVKSAASARLQPRPAAQPRTLHTTGSWMVWTSSITRWAVWGIRRTRSPVRGRSPPLVRPQSTPEQKSVPAPWIWIARSESSVAASVRRFDEGLDHRLAQRVAPRRAIERRRAGCRPPGTSSPHRRQSPLTPPFPRYTVRPTVLLSCTS